MMANRGPEYRDDSNESVVGAWQMGVWHRGCGWLYGLPSSSESGELVSTACLRCERRMRMTPWTDVVRAGDSHCPTYRGRERGRGRREE